MSFMSDLGGRYVDNGYAVLPLMPGSKAPGIYKSGRWGGYFEWTNHCSRLTTAIEIEVWSNYPDAGIGVAGGSAVGIDIDVVEDEAVAIEIEQLARRLLGETPLTRIGFYPKRLLVYRAATPFAGFKAHPIEVLARGQQFVAHAIHPETGQPYLWIEGSPADVPLEMLPAVTEEQCREFAHQAHTLLPETLRPARELNGSEFGNGAHVSNPDKRGTIEGVTSALDWLANNDEPYWFWRNIGMSVKVGIGEAGLAPFMKWSAKSQKDRPEYTLKTFNGFRNIHSIGVATVYREALKAGWIPDPSITINGEIAWDPGHHPAQPLIDEVTATEPHEPAPADANVFVPEAFYRATGVIKDFVDYTLASAPRPQPIFAVTTALCVVAVLAGRRYVGPTGLRTNPYIVDVGSSGCGKEHPRDCADMALVTAGLDRFLAGSKIASGAGLISALVRQPSSLFQIDEFGKFFQQVADKHAPRHKREILDNLTELFTCPIFRGTEYSDQKERPRRTIIVPNCVIHGSTVPGPLWQALQSGALQDGSYARFLFVPTDDPRPAWNEEPRNLSDVPQPLIDGLQRIVAGAKGWQHGNLAEFAEGTPSPAPVPWDNVARDLDIELRDELDRKTQTHSGTYHEALIGRMREHVIKIATVAAVSTNPEAPVVTADAYSWSRQIVDYSVKTMMRDADRFVADSEYEAKFKRIAEIIRTAGNNGIKKSKLARRTSFVDSRTLYDITRRLIDGEQIEEEILVTAGRPATIWRWKRS